MEAYAPFPKLATKATALYDLTSLVMGNNFHNDPVWPTNLKTPGVGAMVIYRDGNSGTVGHTGIVTGIEPDGITYHTIECNTLKKGEIGTNGYIVATHTHRTDQPLSNDLKVHKLVRFIYPMESTV